MDLLYSNFCDKLQKMSHKSTTCARELTKGPA